MRVSAILVVGNWPSSNQDEVNQRSTERFAHTPIVCTEVLGESVLGRTIERLRRSGVNAITVIAEDSINIPESLGSVGVTVVRRAVDRRSLAEVVALQSRMGVEMTLVMRVTAYVEFDLMDMVRFHRSQGGILTRVCDNHGPLELWMMGARAIRQAGMGLNSVAALETTQDSPYFVAGYVNRLNDARDLRRLVVDSFLGRCALKPRGTEIKPGVWVGEGAFVHRCARIVAPAYIGRRTKVRSSALITRFSSLEQDCVIERNTVVEDASVLSCSHIGEDLEISHSVVDGTRLIHLRRQVGVTIEDAKLLSRNQPSATWKLMDTLRRKEVPIKQTGPFAGSFEEDTIERNPVVVSAEPEPEAERVGSFTFSRAEI